MKKKSLERIYKVSLKLTLEEYTAIEKKWKASLCKYLSVYVRNILFDKPIIMTVRNRSLDDLMEETIRLKKELNAIGNSFNQSVQQLQALHQHPEIDQWLLSHALEKEILFNKIDEIKRHLRKIGESWLQ